MVYITQSRMEPNTQRCKTWVLGVQQDTDRKGTPLGLGVVNPVQVTSGFRTGRAVKHLDADEHEADLFNVSNQAEAFAYLKNDLDHYSAQSEYDTGHEFDTTSYRVICTPVVDDSYTGDFGTSKPYRYSGAFMADPGYSPVGAWYAAADVNASYYGPAAIRACAPTHPCVQLAVDLAEFHSEGARVIGSALVKHAERGRSLIVPANPKRRNPYRGRRRRGPNYRLISQKSQGVRRSVVEAGDVASEEYLNWQFGLTPIMQDAQKALQASLDSQTLLEKYQAGSGKLQHRSFHFPILRETLYEDNTGFVSGRLTASSNTSVPNSYAFVNGNRYGIQTESVVRTQRIWFKGAFTYYLQQGQSIVDDVARREQEINYLFGIRVTPEVLWNLQPWSWLVDWNVNIGTNIANAERLSSDGLVLKYGYLMCETTIDHAIVLNGVAYKGPYSGPFTTIFRTTRRQRVKASPFGFSLVPGAFSARQWAILGALGYTRSPESLKTL